MNEGIHLDLDTWIVPGQIRKANLCNDNKLITIYIYISSAGSNCRGGSTAVVGKWQNDLVSQFITIVIL